MIGFVGLFDTARDYTLQLTVLHTHIRVHSYVVISRCSVAAFNSGRSPSSAFPNYPRRQLPASHSNSSQRLNLTSLTQVTNQVNSTDSLTAVLMTSRHGPHNKHLSSVTV
jgi:hypothetical protein